MSKTEPTQTRPSWAIDYTLDNAVKKATEVPALESLAPYERQRMRPGEPLRFAVQAVAEPTSLQGKRAFIISPGPGWSNFELYCDEGTAIGGEDQAPSPLGYLTSAVAFCLLTHITQFLHKVPLRIDRIKVETRGEFWSTMAGAEAGGQGEGGCERFTCNVVIDSDEPKERIANLVDVCRKACMAMQTVAQAVPTSARLLLNGEEVAIGTANA